MGDIIYIIAFLSNFILPFYMNVFTQNISDLSCSDSTYPLYLFWIGINVLALLYGLMMIIKDQFNRQKRFKVLFVISILLFIVAILTPYDPKNMMIAKLHINHTILSVIYYLVLLATIGYILSKRSFYVGGYFLNYVIITIAICLSMTVFFERINAIIEIVFMVGIQLSLYRLRQKVSLLINKE